MSDRYDWDPLKFWLFLAGFLAYVAVGSVLIVINETVGGVYFLATAGAVLLAVVCLMGREFVGDLRKFKASRRTDASS